MWHEPQRLNRVSAALFLLSGLAAAAVATRAMTVELFPFEQVTVLGARHSDTRQAAQRLIPQLKGGFFTLDLGGAQAAFEAIPWVGQATVRRLWPNRLLVELREHVPAAAWNGLKVMDVHGVLFAVKPWPSLPRFHAPDGMEREVARRYSEFHAILAPAGWRIASVQVSPRYAWRIALEKRPPVPGTAPASSTDKAGPQVSLDLGREKLVERLQRFVTFYPAAVASAGPLTQVDLRYPNGFAALRPDGSAVQRAKAKAT